MTDETMERATTEPETAIEAQVPNDEPRNDNIEIPDEPETESGNEIPSEDDDFEDVDWQGRQYKLPKGIKDSLLMQADYTRKTQEVASHRKELEQRAKELHEQAQADDVELKARAAVSLIDEQLKAYQNVNWSQWHDQDMIAADKAFMQYTQLKDLRQEAVNEFNSRYQARIARAQQEFAKREQETRQFAEKNIKGWSPDMEDKMLNFLSSELGMEKAQAKSQLTPQLYKLAHLAWVGQQALSKPAAKPAAQQPAPKPLETVAAKANPPAKKDVYDSSLSMEDYAALRQKQMANRGRR